MNRQRNFWNVSKLFKMSLRRYNPNPCLKLSHIPFKHITTRFMFASSLPEPQHPQTQESRIFHRWTCCTSRRRLFLRSSYEWEEKSWKIELQTRHQQFKSLFSPYRWCSGKLFLPDKLNQPKSYLDCSCFRRLRCQFHCTTLACLIGATPSHRQTCNRSVRRRSNHRGFALELPYSRLDLVLSHRLLRWFRKCECRRSLLKSWMASIFQLLSGAKSNLEKQAWNWKTIAGMTGSLPSFLAGPKKGAFTGGMRRMISSRSYDFTIDWISSLLSALDPFALPAFFIESPSHSLSSPPDVTEQKPPQWFRSRSFLTLVTIFSNSCCGMYWQILDVQISFASNEDLESCPTFSPSLFTLNSKSLEIFAELIKFSIQHQNRGFSENLFRLHSIVSGKNCEVDLIVEKSFSCEANWDKNWSGTEFIFCVHFSCCWWTCSQVTSPTCRL